MRLTCPHCGTRDVSEFTPKGAALPRPESGEWAPEWDTYLHLRDNPEGESREHWQHAPCGAWLVVTRDTKSHEILAVDFAGGDA